MWDNRVERDVLLETEVLLIQEFVALPSYSMRCKAAKLRNQYLSCSGETPCKELAHGAEEVLVLQNPRERRQT